METKTEILKKINEDVLDAFEILALVKTSPQTVQPLSVAYRKLDQALAGLAHLTETIR